MDGRDDMSLPESYYMQRGLPGPVTQSGFNRLSGMQFQSNIGTSSIGLLPIEQSLPISPHNNNNVSVNMPLSESVKRKRGRPRKYGSDHGGVSLALSPLPSAPPAMITSSPTKRGRGRPLGSGKKKQLLPSLGDWMSGSAGTGFTPHVIAIAAGDDITTKIMSFSQQGHRAICVLSANGSVSSVTLRQPSTSGGTVTYEGRFEILCLSGSYLLTDNAASRNRSGGLNVTLAGPNGRVIGGGVAGMLIAASPIQVIVGSFLCSNLRTKNKRKESTNGAADFSDIQTFENSLTAANVQLLNPGSLMDVWPGSRAVDMQNSHIDIDLMRR